MKGEITYHSYKWDPDKRAMALSAYRLAEEIRVFLTNKEAHEMADWIKERVPREP